MALSHAERQRRYRAHQAGDHRLCAPDRDCRQPPSPSDTVTTPAGLSSRGVQLWRDLKAHQLPPVQRALALEVCRTVGRLDRLDVMLRDGRSRGWMEIVVPEYGVVHLMLDDALKEVRQQQAVFRQLVTELRTALGDQTSGSGGGDEFDELAEARARRIAAAFDS